MDKEREYRWIERESPYRYSILLFIHTNKWEDDCVFVSDGDIRLLVNSLRSLDDVYRCGEYDDRYYNFISGDKFYQVTNFINGESQIEIAEIFSAKRDSI